MRAPSFFFLLASITFSGMSDYVRPHLLLSSDDAQETPCPSRFKNRASPPFSSKPESPKFFVGFGAGWRFTGDK